MTRDSDLSTTNLVFRRYPTTLAAVKNSLFCGKSQADNAFSADSRGLFAAAGEWNRPTTITCWNVANAVQVVEFKHTGEVLSITVSSDGKGLAAGGADKTVSIWKITPTPEQ